MNIKSVIFITFLMFSFTIQAQNLALKAGLNFTNSYFEYKGLVHDYPSYDASIETGIGKKFSLSAAYNYLKRGEVPAKSDCNVGNHSWTNEDHVFIAEGRYYTKSNTTGFFLSLGFPFTHSTEREYYWENENVVVKQYFAITTLAELGVKIPFTSAVGIEFHTGLSPHFSFTSEDIGNSGFLKIGFRLYCSFGKNRDTNG